MGFEVIIVLLSVALFGIPVLAWVALKRLSAAEKMRQNSAEMHALENSLSLMIKELQESVRQALSDMEEAADRLNQTIEQADSRIRQLDYYYEYADELRPLVQTNTQHVEPAPAPVAQGPALKHKEVHELSRKGWSTAQIARHTGMSADEVQLIVNLMELSTMAAQRIHEQPSGQQRQSMI